MYSNLKGLHKKHREAVRNGEEMMVSDDGEEEEEDSDLPGPPDPPQEVREVFGLIKVAPRDRRNSGVSILESVAAVSNEGADDDENESVGTLVPSSLVHRERSEFVIRRPVVLARPSKPTLGRKAMPGTTSPMPIVSSLPSSEEKGQNGTSGTTLPKQARVPRTKSKSDMGSRMGASTHAIPMDLPHTDFPGPSLSRELKKLASSHSGTGPSKQTQVPRTKSKSDMGLSPGTSTNVVMKLPSVDLPGPSRSQAFHKLVSSDSCTAPTKPAQVPRTKLKSDMGSSPGTSTHEIPVDHPHVEFPGPSLSRGLKKLPSSHSGTGPPKQVRVPRSKPKSDMGSTQGTSTHAIPMQLPHVDSPGPSLSQGLNKLASSKSGTTAPKLSQQVSRSKPKGYMGSNKGTSANVFPMELTPVDCPVAALSQGLDKLASADWETNIDGFRLLVRILRHHTDSIRGEMHTVNMTALRHLSNLRSQVSRAACLFFEEMFSTLGRLMELDVEKITEKLLEKSVDTNKFIKESGGAALEAMATNLVPSKTLVALENFGAKHRNALVRTTTARLTALIVKQLGPERSLAQMADKLLPMLIRFLQEGSQQTRSHAKESLSILMSHESFQAALRQYVPPETLRHVEKALDTINHQLLRKR